MWLAVMPRLYSQSWKTAAVPYDKVTFTAVLPREVLPALRVSCPIEEARY